MTILKVSRGFATGFIVSLCLSLFACHGGMIQSGGPLPTVVSDSVFPHFFRVTPFKESAKPISKSDGQNVYALFGWTGIKIGKSAANLTTFGASATGGYTGPLAQVAIVTSSTQSQHVFTYSSNYLAEFTDAATSTIMLTKPTPGNLNDSTTIVCTGKKEIGTITIKKGKTTVSRASKACPKSPIDDDFSPAVPAVETRAGTAPSAADVNNDICALGTNAGVPPAIPLAATLLTAAGKTPKGKPLDPALAPLGSAYAAFGTFLAEQCKHGVKVSPPKPSPCTPEGGGSACTYVNPPVTLNPLQPLCTGNVSTITVVFYAPGKNCTFNLGGTPGDTFVVTNPSPNLVTIAPASGTVGSGGTVTFTVTPTQLGGSTTATVVISSGATVQSTTYVSVTNNWAGQPTFTQFALPSSNADPSGIVVGPDHALWFTEYQTGKIGRMTTDGTLTEYPLAAGANAAPFEIAVGPDGALWFGEDNAAAPQIGRITTTGAITEFPLTAGAAPAGIVAGPDQRLWFADEANGAISAITTTGSGTDYMIPSANSGPAGIAVGADGALWFTETQTGIVGRVTTTGAFTEYTLPASGGQPIVYAITAGPDGNLWTGDISAAQQMFSITTAGTITAYSAPNFLGNAITTGPDGALWFAGGLSTTPIGRVTTAGVFAFPTLPTSAQANGIVTGPDGNLWITDTLNNTIDRIQPGILFSGESRSRHRLRVPARSKQ